MGPFMRYGKTAQVCVGALSQVIIYNTGLIVSGGTPRLRDLGLLNFRQTAHGKAEDN